MRRVYGKSRADKCLFCDKQALVKNSQGLYVCHDHRKQQLEDIKCVCGSYLEIRNGKWGPYFYCMNCGNINLKKGLSMRSR